MTSARKIFHFGFYSTISTIFKISGIVAVLIFAHSAIAIDKKENWQSVRIPVSNADGTVYIYDKNSISVTRGARGDSSGAELTAKIVRGDESIQGKVVLFTFLCDGRFRINHSYPFPVPELSQEEYMQNIACGAVACMKMKKENSPLACSY